MKILIEKVIMELCIKLLPPPLLLIHFSTKSQLITLYTLLRDLLLYFTLAK